MLHKRRAETKTFDPIEAVEDTEIVPRETTEEKPAIKQKSILRLTKDLIEAGNELKRQIEQSRLEREEFKKLIAGKAEIKEEVKIEEEIKPETV
jgi:hypothetical protein